MNKNKLLRKYYLPLGLILLLMAGQAVPVLGQSIGSNLYVQNKGVTHHHDAHNMVPLTRVLKKIERSHHITFLYQAGLLKGKEVSKKMLESDDLGSKLWKLLSNLGLTYLEQSEGTYVIRPLPKLNIRPVAQQETVSGTVTDAQTGDPLPGVNILVVGTSTGAATDANGHYSVSVPSLQDTLRFSFIGYETTNVPIDGRTNINIKLSSTILSSGNELVVVGYGTQKKKNLTGAVSQVKGKKLATSPVQSLSNSFAGNIPGVIAMNRSGEPGDDRSNILIRGKSTLGNNSPLVVVNGVPGRKDLNQIDPHNIKSISVLKDASAAIYGARAANGVILVTTKRGIESKPVVSYRFNEGFTQPANLPQMADAAHYAKFYNQLLENQGQPPRFTEEDIQKFRDGSDPVGHPNTDWVDATMKNFATQSQHHLSVQGGGQAVRYYFAGDYKNANGIFKNGNFKYQAWGLRGNSDIIIPTDSIKLTIDFSIHHGTKLRPGSSIGTIMNSIWRSYPWLVPYYSNGLPGAGIERGENPVVLVTNKTGFRRYRDNIYNSKIGIDIPIPVKGLALSGYFAYDKNNEISKLWNKPWTVYNYNSDTDTYSSETGGSLSQPELQQGLSINRRITTNTKLLYKRDIGSNSIKAFLAFGYFSINGSNFSAERRHFLSDALPELFAGSKEGQRANGSASLFKRAQLIGRVSYNYKEKYLANFNFNYDGSSKFPTGHRWGFFPGLSVGWTITNEKFLQNRGDWLTNLKLRASIGEMGNDQIASNQFLQTFSYATGYFLGTDLAPATGLRAGVLPNPLITWESQRSIDIGLDANFWQGGLGLTIDIFKKKRSNILTQRNASIPEYAAINLPDENIGVVSDKGFEFEINHQQFISNDFNLTISGNVSYSRNKVVSIDEPAGVIPWQSAEGHPIGSRLLYKAIGIFRSQEELDNTPHVANANVGDLIYKDINEDGNISGKDRIRVNKSPTPQFTYGLTVAMNYKDISFTMLWQGVANSRRYFRLQSGTGGNMVKDVVNNMYYPDNPNSKYPTIGTQSSGFDNTFWYRDSGFLRFKNVKFSYSIPEIVFERIGIGIKSLSVYFSGEDLLTFSKFRWFDPEGEATNRQNFYPPNRIFNIGINIKI
jgi:TonB-linked SusC/RagA family outer membrane protein